MHSRQPTPLKIHSNQIEAAGISDPGRVRSENQDAICLDDGGLFLLLADGMGGHERGAEASTSALEIIQEYLQPDVIAEELSDITEGSGIPAEIVCLTSLVDEAVRRANDTLYQINRSENLKRYMGTTVVGMIVPEGDKVLWFHVGDSRLYRLRDSGLTRLTTDHSAHIEWERNGRLGAEPGKNVITRAIGPSHAVTPETLWDTRQSGDMYLLCSDGLTDMISDDEIALILNEGGDVPDICSRLIRAANDAGGGDNVSVVLCRV